MLADLKRNNASARSEWAHGALLVWLWDATTTDHDHRSDHHALVAGYCAHK